MLDIESMLLGMAADGGGGSNPNYVETITGTLANLMPDGGWSSLVTDILNNCATVNGKMSGGGQTGVFNIVPNSSGNNVYGVASSVAGTLANSAAMSAFWNVDGTIRTCYFLQNGAVEDMTSMAQYLNTTLTIIHHPMP